jgi:hypothetical protein
MLSQVLDWRMPMDAGQYQVYADALFGAAANTLLGRAAHAGRELDGGS